MSIVVVLVGCGAGIALCWLMCFVVDRVSAQFNSVCEELGADDLDSWVVKKRIFARRAKERLFHSSSRGIVLTLVSPASLLEVCSLPVGQSHFDYAYAAFKLCHLGLHDIRLDRRWV